MADEHEATEQEEGGYRSRAFARGAVRISSEIRESGGGKQRVSVIDLSRAGFRMHCVFLIPSGHTVYLTMPGFESMEAKIMWHDGDYYGCQFKQRLHEAIYDHVIRTYPMLSRRV